MRAALAVSILFTIANAQSQAQECKPHKEIFCGDEKHVLSKADCDRGLVWQYCTKTLRRTPPSDRCISPSAIDWDRTLPWRLLLSSTPILTLPCLSIDDSSLTLVCQEERCDNSTLNEDIEVCTERYSRGLVRYVERPDAEAKDTQPERTDSSPLFDIRIISALLILTLLLILSLVLLQLVSTCKNSVKLERLHREMCLNAALPTIPTRKEDEENDYEALPISMRRD